jgi:prepilin-type N-terminal cleavage/methylation domain-containing protein
LKARGFTLIELVISIVVISLVIGTVLTVYASLGRMTITPDAVNRCTFLAERELERINQMRFSAVVNEGPVNYTMAGFTDYSYQIITAVPPVALGLGNDMTRGKQVTITVSHPAFGQVVLTTLVTRNG